jgi:hypothetical protein
MFQRAYSDELIIWRPKKQQARGFTDALRQASGINCAAFDDKLFKIGQRLRRAIRRQEY